MLYIYDSLEWGILQLICVWQRDRDVTGEGQGWRNGHGWGWREFFNIIMLEKPIPLYVRKCLVNVLGGKKSLCTFQGVMGNHIHQSGGV